MNSFWAIASVGLLGIGYTVGWQHGGDRARSDIKPLEVETVVADYPYSGVCSAMLEAAWSVDDAMISGSPHKP